MGDQWTGAQVDGQMGDGGMGTWPLATWQVSHCAQEPGLGSVVSLEPSMQNTWSKPPECLKTIPSEGLGSTSPACGERGCRNSPPEGCFLPCFP